MSRKKMIFYAALLSALLVVAARFAWATENDWLKFFGIAVLLTGQVLVIFTQGVHGDWDGIFAQFLMVAVPFTLWLVIFYHIIAAVQMDKSAGPLK